MLVRMRHELHTPEGALLQILSISVFRENPYAAIVTLENRKLNFMQFRGIRDFTMELYRTLVRYNDC
jgi:hypothetical protein